MDFIKSIGSLTKVTAIEFINIVKINAETPYLTPEIKTILLIIGGFIGALMGGMDSLLYALIVMMCVDYISGVILAIVNHKMSSKIGSRGIAKKGYILLFVIIGNIIDVRLIGQGSTCRTAVIFFYTVNEILSITENAGNLGLPIPKKLMDILVQIKKENQSDENNSEDYKK